MNAHEITYQILDGLSNEVKTIRPTVLHPNDEFPAVIIREISETPIGTLMGDTSNLDTVRMQIDAWDYKLIDALYLSDKIRKAFRETNLTPNRYDGKNVVYDSTTNLHGVQIDIIMHVER